MPPLDLPGVMQIATVGKTVTIISNTATSPTLVPLNLNGTNPKVVRIVADNKCHIKFGQSTAAANSCTMNDTLILPNSGSDLFNIAGQPFFSVCLDSSSPTTAVLNIAPIEAG